MVVLLVGTVKAEIGVAVFRLPAGRGVFVAGAIVGISVAVLLGNGVSESTPVTVGVGVRVGVVVGVGVLVAVGVLLAVGLGVAS